MGFEVCETKVYKNLIKTTAKAQQYIVAIFNFVSVSIMHLC